MIAMQWFRIGRLGAVLATLAAVPSAAILLRPIRSTHTDSSVPGPVQIENAEGRVDTLTTQLVTRDPFRMARRPADRPYDPDPPPPQPPDASPPKPALILTGIVWSGEPTAVLEGLPGVDGARLVRTGEVYEGLRIRRISASTVVVAGWDTTWVLEVRKPW